MQIIKFLFFNIPTNLRKGKKQRKTASKSQEKTKRQRTY